MTVEAGVILKKSVAGIPMAPRQRPTVSAQVRGSFSVFFYFPDLLMAVS